MPLAGGLHSPYKPLDVVLDLASFDLKITSTRGEQSVIGPTERTCLICSGNLASRLLWKSGNVAYWVCEERL